MFMWQSIVILPDNKVNLYNVVNKYMSMIILWYKYVIILCTT